jgi:FtsP/CotA-like multicopper oxidase with cupredoxin domain
VGTIGRPKTFFYINGQCQPTIQIAAGRTYRWRFINATATPQGLMKLRMIQCSTDPNSQQNCPAPSTALNQSAPPGPTIPMNLTAVDGISFYGFHPQPVQAHLMAPGNRADFLINLPPGRYVLYKDAFPQDATCITSTTPVGASNASKQVLAYIIVGPASYDDDPPPDTLTIPGTRPFYLQPITKVDNPNPQVVAFQNPSNTAGTFQINQQFYQPGQILINAQLNTAEEWTVHNSQGFNTHPFHIHVNPFQVVGRTIDFETANPSLDPTNPANWMWMDTVALPMPVTGAPACPQVTNQGSAGGQLTLRTRYLVYPGEYVIHCHILIHEDVGMMANVKINDDGSGIGPCVPLSQPTPEAVACVQRTS